MTTTTQHDRVCELAGLLLREAKEKQEELTPWAALVAAARLTAGE